MGLDRDCVRMVVADDCYNGEHSAGLREVDRVRTAEADACAHGAQSDRSDCMGHQTGGSSDGHQGSLERYRVFLDKKYSSGGTEYPWDVSMS